MSRSTRERKFWERVAQGKPDECWPWLGKRRTNGYGSVMVSRRETGAHHRLAYFFVKGDIPEGLYVLHSCDNPPCCNPAHLYAGTPQQNMDDRSRRNRWAGSTLCGEEHGRAKLTSDDVRAIRASSLSYKRLAAQYGMAQSQIARIKRGEQWRSIP